MEIFRKESQNRLSRGQVPEHHQPGEAVQSLEQLQDRWGALGSEKWGRGWGQGSKPLLLGRGPDKLCQSLKLSPVHPEAFAADADAHMPQPTSWFTCCFRTQM